MMLLSSYSFSVVVKFLYCESEIVSEPVFNVPGPASFLELASFFVVFKSIYEDGSASSLLISSLGVAAAVFSEAACVASVI
jgi:hypothetical protein